MYIHVIRLLIFARNQCLTNLNTPNDENCTPIWSRTYPVDEKEHERKEIRSNSCVPLPGLKSNQISEPKDNQKVEGISQVHEL